MTRMTALEGLFHRVWKPRVASGMVLMLACVGAHAQSLPTPGHGTPLRLVSILALDRPVMVQEKLLLDVLFSRAGVGYTLETVPAERALVDFRNGTYDGDVNRIATFSQSHPEAVRVDPHVQSAFFYAVGVAQGPLPAGWSDLTPYRVAYVRGFKGIEIRTAGVAHREVANSDESCLRMAQARRVDWCVLPADRKNEWPMRSDFGAELTGALLDAVKVHIWLGPQHRELAQTLSRTLRDLERSGSLGRIMGTFRQAD
ncbi:hypothetical protein RQP54_18900 [Curvibacter sp. APW13]|uniref:hypothetical protein n=1 Tax=Curvibacter sp. APW13 TaxID=3077236 RepID=UPI0028DD98C2|nr:hypothetical protein [Curvibacter sp. APW13]MDT8992949.1 hypothetical protein [Curvibacter sp. APW13]